MERLTEVDLPALRFRLRVTDVAMTLGALPVASGESSRVNWVLPVIGVVPLFFRWMV